MKIRDLTRGERALIHRRREGWSQRQAADHWGLSLYAYRQCEDDDPPETNTDEVVRSWPKVALGRLEPHEICFLYRRRSGMQLQELADTLGISRWWLCRMEYGTAPCDRLHDYWSRSAKPWRGGKKPTAATK